MVVIVDVPGWPLRVVVLFVSGEQEVRGVVESAQAAQGPGPLCEGGEDGVRPANVGDASVTSWASCSATKPILITVEKDRFCNHDHLLR
jgi:hypothetical protein